MVVLGFFYAGRIMLWVALYSSWWADEKSTFQMDPNILAAVSVDSVEAFWMCRDPKLHIA